MTEKILAPFTPEHIKQLNDFQKNKFYHPFTCGGGTGCYRAMTGMLRRAGVTIDYTDESEGVLIATEEGWVCPCGSYQQNWAHSFMANPEKP